MDYLQTELNLGVASIPGSTEEWRSPQYDPYWDELASESQPTCKSVGEQVSQSTKKTAPQHDTEVTHWVEKYWVKRGNNKYWYYRYMWMEGRKIRRKYIGSATSTKAKSKKQVVDEGIGNNLLPEEITILIDQFSTNSRIH